MLRPGALVVPMQLLFPGWIDQACVKGLGMQIDSAIELVLSFIQFHFSSLWMIVRLAKSSGVLTPVKRYVIQRVHDEYQCRAPKDGS